MLYLIINCNFLLYFRPCNTQRCRTLWNMSSPSPSDIQKSSDHAYQTSETSEHSLLKHPHVCSCYEKDPLPKTDHSTHCHLHPKATHTHNVINMSHGNPTSHIHPTTQSVHVHVHASPKSGNAPKLPPPVCNCHLEETSEDAQEIRESSGVQETKQDADDRIEISPLPPALPPRPPPRPRLDGQGSLSARGHFSRGMLFRIKTYYEFTTNFKFCMRYNNQFLNCF